MSDQSKRHTISLPPDVHLQAKRKAKKRGFRNSFSAYVAKLIEEDRTLVAADASQPATGRAAK